MMDHRRLPSRWFQGRCRYDIPGNSVIKELKDRIANLVSERDEAIQKATDSETELSDFELKNKMTRS